VSLGRSQHHVLDTGSVVIPRTCLWPSPPLRRPYRSAASLLFAQGVEAATVQHILGHSSNTVTTCIYVDVIEQVQHDALSKLDGLITDDQDDDTSTG
jgi:hypothetical protein